MQWLGLSPLVLASIFGSAATALIALHLVRRHRRETIVPFLELFVKDASEARALTFLSRRLLWLSLLLLLAIAGLVVAAAGDPRFDRDRGAGKNLVVAIDVSRSMGTIERGTSRLELAKREARRVVRSLGPTDRAAIVSIGAEPEGRSALTDDRASLLRAIDGLEVEDVHDDLQRTIRFANEILAGKPRASLVVLGDGATRDSAHVDELDRSIAIHATSFGSASENVGIVAFAARRYRRDRSQAEIRAVVRNAGRESRECELVLESGGRPLDVRRITIPGGDVREISLRHVGGAGQAFAARIRPVDGHVDALPTDDVAYTTLPPRPTTKVLVVSDDDLYLEAATYLDETVEPTVIAPSAYTDADGFDLVVFDATLPRSAPTVPALYFAPRPKDARYAPFETRRDVMAPAITRVVRDDALMRHLDFEDVAIARALDLVTARGDVVLVASRTTPLVVRGTREGRRFLAVAFDLRESDLPLRMAFPVFIVRAIEELVTTPGEFEDSFRTDSVARIPVATESPRVAIIDPRGHRTEAPVLDGLAVFRPRWVGLHRVLDSDGEHIVAAGLGPVDETAVHPGRYLRHGRALPNASFRGSGIHRRPWTWLIAAAMLLLGFEWFSHHRRWTA